MLSIVMMLIHGRAMPDAGGSQHAPWLDYMFPEDERAGFRRFLVGPLTDGGTDDLTVASTVQHYAVRMAGVLLTPKDVAWLDWVDRRTP